jgi:hypothetical protein
VTTRDPGPPVASCGIRDLQAERWWLLGRYDHGALSPAVYERVRAIEIALAWLEHHQAAPTPILEQRVHR